MTGYSRPTNAFNLILKKDFSPNLDNQNPLSEPI